MHKSAPGAHADGGPIRVRSVSLLITGLSCLVAAVVLGGLLVHDGEVGTDARLDALHDGDDVRLKGDAMPAPTDVAGALNHTIRLATPEGELLVTAAWPLPTSGTWVVTGIVADADPLLVIADDIHQPFVFG